MNRYGKSLIELLFVLAATGALLLVVGTIMSSTFRADTAHVEASRRLNASSQLAARFRADAHAAIGVEMKPSPAGKNVRTLVFAQPGDRRVTYEIADEVRRTVRREDERIAYEAWPLTADAVRMELPDSGSRAVLVIRTKETTAVGAVAAGVPVGPGAGLRVEARIGFDHRFARKTP